MIRVTSVAPKMESTLTEEGVDHILAIQLWVAWAGEGRCDPKRLGWWDTDLVDEAGGADLFRRLLPKTRYWAGLHAAREAAKRTDAKARARTGQPDHLRTIFFLGYETDEKVNDRLLTLKLSDGALPKHLPLPLSLESAWSPEAFSEALSKYGKIQYETTPSGRLLKGKRPDSEDVMVGQLAGALVPVAERYPMAYYLLPK